MNVYRTILALFAVLILGPAIQAQTGTATYNLPRMEHRFEGLVADAFMADDGSLLWTCEDGGRIRFRDGTNPWVYLDTPDQAQNTLRAIHFVPHLSGSWSSSNTLVGWCVGDDPQVFKTTNGGLSWSIAHTGLHSQVGGNTYGQLRDIHFIRHPTQGLLGWMVGLHDIWKSIDGGTSWSNVALLDQTGSPINPADIELYAVDILQCGSNEPIIAVCGEPGLVFRNEPATLPQNWGTSMKVSWNILNETSTALGICGPDGLYNGIHHPLNLKLEIWDIEFQRTCDGEPLLIMVAGSPNLPAAAFSSRDLGFTFARECHECDGSSSPCTGSSDYHPTAAYAHYYRNDHMEHLYGVAVFADGSAVAGGYGGEHLVRDSTTGVWVDRSQRSPWVLHATHEVSNMFLNGAVCQRNAGSSSSNGKAFLVGQGGQGRSTTNAVSTTPTPAPPTGEPGENWTEDWTDPTGVIIRPSGWWRMHALSFSYDTTLNAHVGWRTGQNYHIARTDNGGTTWQLENVLPYGYGAAFQSIAISPTSDSIQGSGVAVGEYDTRDLSWGIPFGCSHEYVNQPKILRRSVNATSSAIEWIEPSHVAWISRSGAAGLWLEDVTWADTIGSDDVYWACGWAETVLFSTNGGDTWKQEAGPTGSGATGLVALAFRNKDEGVFVGQNTTSGVAIAFGLRFDSGAGTYVWYDVSPTTSGAIKLLDVALDGAIAYAVGTVNTGAGAQGTVFSSTFEHGAFTKFEEITGPVSGGVPPCSIGDALGDPPLNRIAVATNGDLWVGGECGRIWRRNSSGWEEIKSQTDGHIRAMAPTPDGYVYAASMRINLTGPAVVRWKPQ